jgi:hypothetical protein
VTAAHPILTVTTDSVFAGADVCQEARLILPDGVPRPNFDDDAWDLTEVVGLPRQLALQHRRFGFAAIDDIRWRLVAKELVLALLAPHHPAVVNLPRAYRAPHHVSTCHGRLDELIRLMRWLPSAGVADLAALTSDDCDAYLFHRRYQLDDNGIVVGERGSATRRLAALIITDLLNYRDLFTADRVPANLRPWGGATPSAVAEDQRSPGENKTPPVPDKIFQPAVGAALYLVTALGPHALKLAHELEEHRKWAVRAEGLRTATRVPVDEMSTLLAEYEQARRPLPLMAEHHVRDRLAAGWSADDPLVAIGTGVLARQAGFRQFHHNWLAALRGPLEDTLKIVGAEPMFCRQAPLVDRVDGQGAVPWTAPLHKDEASALIGTFRTATVLVVAAITGMRSSELMELEVGCRQPVEEHGPGLLRYRLSGKLVKGQPLGGVRDEWVVIEPAYQAAALAEQLHDNPAAGASLLGRFHIVSRYQWFRNWVNSPAGQRLGLAPIPDGRVNIRMLRRKLALELAYRPGGLLAAKIVLHHVSAATTEGYASRPGGAQAQLLAEISEQEQQRNLDLLWAEFRNYQQGVMPAGPGARDLVDFFAHVDRHLGATRDGEYSPVRVQHADRDVLNLLSKRARTLHLGASNYCWFTDPSRALCLKLAGTPTADRPLIGMCDSARCPQATHHNVHRSVWGEHAERTATFLGQLGPTRKAEKARLQSEYDRALRVVAEIDAAAAAKE